MGSEVVGHRRTTTWALCGVFGLFGLMTLASGEVEAQEIEEGRLKVGHGVTLCLKGAIQPRLRLDVTDGPEVGEERRLRMFIRRARLTVCGEGLVEGLSWKLQVGWDRGSAELKDAQIDVALSPRVFELRVGQVKRPWSRSFIGSGFEQEFIERSVTHNVFRPGRDLGVMVHDGLESSPTLEWALGAFNGTGDAARFRATFDGEGHVNGGAFSHDPGNAHPLLVGRVGYNHGGIKGYSEGDLEGGPLRLAVAMAGQADFEGAFSRGEAMNLGLDLEVDGVLKLEGASLSAAGYLSTTEVEGGRRIEAVGGHVQAGYVVGRRFEPALRGAWVDRRLDALTQQELALAFSIYLDGHKVAWVIDGTAVRDVPDDGETSTELLVRSQVQVVF